jgi:hypothetical protein
MFVWHGPGATPSKFSLTVLCRGAVAKGSGWPMLSHLEASYFNTPQ